MTNIISCNVGCYKRESLAGNDDFETNAMLVAARRGDVAAVSSLLSQGVDVNQGASCSKIHGMDGASALIWAARQGVAIHNLNK